MFAAVVADWRSPQDHSMIDQITIPGPASVSAPSGQAGAAPSRARFGRRWARAAVWLPVLALLGLAYAPNLAELARTWSRNPNYSHGYMVAPVALFLFWRQRAGAAARPARGSRWGGVLLVVALGLRALFYERGVSWLETATLLPVVASLVLGYGGWSTLRRALPGIVFLIFMLPLPARVDTLLALPLQKLATVASCAVMKLSGLWVIAEGNVILVDSSRLEVATACNGLSMLMCMAATVVAITFLVPMARWKQVVLVASFVPIALVCNVLRITATAWCYHLFGAKVGEDIAHDWAGFLMMPLAMVLVYLELLALSWLVVEEQVEEARPGEPLLPGWAVPPGPAGPRP
jgi:exosortase